MVGFLGLTPGSVFAGDFEVRRVIARGGMGAVYHVWDRADGAERALKLLLPELVADERMRERFTREARVHQEMRSLYVPRVYRAGIDEKSGVPYIAMDLLEGVDLRKHVDKFGAIAPAEAQPILEQIGEALGEAHARGLIHRDLKPDNVFLDETGGERRVKLLDFGVVKVIDPNHTSGTGTGAVGSPMWMAPEQTSAGGRIAPSTDVWAFGLLSYFVLTGSLYWKAGFDDSGVAGLLREMHIEDIERPSLRVQLTAPGKTLPPKFDDWFASAVARDSNARFRTAGAALEALRPVLADVTGRANTTEMAFMETVEVDTGVLRAIDPARLSKPGGTTPMGSQSPPASPVAEEVSRTIAGVAGLAKPRPESSVRTAADGLVVGEEDAAATIPASSEIARAASEAVAAERAAEAARVAEREAARAAEREAAEHEAEREALREAEAARRAVVSQPASVPSPSQPPAKEPSAPWAPPPPQWSEVPLEPARPAQSAQPAGVFSVPLTAPPLTPAPFSAAPPHGHDPGEPADPSIPTTDPPPPGKDGPSLFVWVAVVFVVGILVAMLSGVIVWIFLMITDPSPVRDRAPEPEPEVLVGALSLPASALEVHPS